MKCVSMLALLTFGAARAQKNPLSEVISLMDELTAKVTADGVAEDKAFTKYVAWCDDTTQNQRNEIKTANTKSDELNAAISKASADIEAADGIIEDLAGKIAKADSELKDATLIREKEAKEFAVAEAELVDTLSALSRAIQIISKEMAKNPAAFVQMDTSSMAGLVSALSSIVDAASLTVADKKTLVAFAQSESQDSDDAPGAPDPAAYKSHSKGILDTLEDLKAKAEEQLATLRKEESNTKQNYALLKQSLEDEMAYNTKEKSDEQAFKSETAEAKATAEADLASTTQLLKDTEAAFKATQADCMKIATDHDTSVAGRNAELKTIAEAKKILMTTTSGASEETYSFLQTERSSLVTSADLKGAEVSRFIKRLARQQHSEALAQLASRVSALLKYGAGAGEDPFKKVKGLIRDMIAKLEAEADAAATEKAYCDEQMAKTEAKKSELEDDVAKLTSKIDSKSAQSAKLKEEVKVLQSELANLAKEQAEMDSIRAEQKADYDQAKADLELGLTGVQKALSVLRKYYQGEGAALVQQPAKPVFHSKAEGAGGSIIDILEVVESDFAKNLAEEESTEADAIAAYVKRTQEIKVSTAEKQQSVKYKVQEFKGLDKDVAELSADRKATNEELASVLDYYAKVKDRCIAKPETYEERKARREAEIKGLKEALSILNEETAPELLQTRHRRSLRATSLSA
jgi:hypothetical protein